MSGKPTIGMGVFARGALMGSACVLALAASAPLMAQTADLPAAESEYNDIIVTARKRAESVQDVPVTITAFSAQQIERGALTNLEQVAASVPQFVIGRSVTGAGASLSMRGISTSSTATGVEQSVAVVVDSVYYGTGRVINEALFDLQRLEVMKGPQALFYGKNATAGVISVATADPGPDFELIARAGYEFRSEKAYAEFVASGPIANNLGLRLAVRGSRMFGGYYKNKATDSFYRTRDVVTGTVTDHTTPPAAAESPGEREIYARLTAKWQPTSELTATLKVGGGRTYVNNAGWNLKPVGCVTGFSALNANIPCDRTFTNYQSNFPTALTIQPFAKKNGSLYNEYVTINTTGIVEYAADGYTITSVSNYTWNRNRWAQDPNVVSSGPNGIFSTENNRFAAMSSELRLLTKSDGVVNAMIGGYYQHTKRKLDQWTPSAMLENSAAPDPRYRYLGNIKDSNTTGETLSVFGQVIFNPVPNVELTGGARFIHETKDSDFVQPYSHPTGVANGQWVPNSPLIAHQKFTDWSPEVTAKWTISDGFMVFGAFKTGYKSGGFNNTTTQGRGTSLELLLFKPESARGFEGGIKSTLMDRQLKLNLIAYSYKYDGLQVEAFNPSTFALTATNAGSARVKGVELEMQWLPRAIDGFSLAGSVNYNKSRYIDFIAPCWTGQKPSEGCNLTSSRFGPSQDLSGSPTALAPLWTAAIGANYETPISSDLVIGGSVNARYSDDYLASQFAHPLSGQPKYVNLDASIRVAKEDGSLELALIGKNLTNRFVITGAVENIQTGSGTATPAGRFSDIVGLGSLPRTVQLQLTWRH